MGSAPPSLHVTIEPGTKLDRYELLCLLARGGMANVWLARMAGKHGFEKLLAVKTIVTNEVDNESFKDMFLDEARLASRIEHPSVVRVMDVGEYIGAPYLVMELVDGDALDKLVRTAEKAGVRVPIGVALRVVADACHGLHAAHELKDADGAPLHVVHRDVSPQNILITTAGVAKLFDFGIAKARDRSAGPTTTGTLKGKISYMPREQALGKEVDARADTWALGAVLYYILAGRPPYKEETQLATLRMAMSGGAIEPLPKTIPALVRSFVNKALTQDIEGRFQTAAEMAEALEQLIRRLGTVTTHGEVGAFLKSVMHDKIEARKQLIAHALSEAAHRERSGVDITIHAGLEIGEGTSIESGVHSAALNTLSSRQSVAPDESGISNALGTSGTVYPPPRVPVWHSVLLVLIALMGAVGCVLLAAVLATRHTPSAQASTGETVTSTAVLGAGDSAQASWPSVTVGANANANANTNANANATANANANARTPSPPPTGIRAPSPPSTTALGHATTLGVARAPIKPVTTATSTSTAVTPAPAVVPAASTPATTTTKPAKKRDDEAGF